MKKNKKIVLIVIAIITLIILSFFGGQAYAKYMTRITGKGTAQVANWSFKVNNTEDTMQTISLKSTINNSTLLNNKIAPGTEGKFQIKLDATNSDVGASYSVKFENETQKPTNLKFIYEEATYNTLADLQKVLIGEIPAESESKIKVLEIGWKWNYETGTNSDEILTNDLLDTKEAKRIRDYNFDIVVSGIQQIPK